MVEAHNHSRPVIGVTSLRGTASWIEKNTLDYLRVLEEHSATGVVLSPDAPVLFPDGCRHSPDEDGVLPGSVLDALDGIVLAGGGDVHPSRFGQEVDGAEPDRIDPERDALELSLARTALERDIPVLGICRGCQVLNVAAGGGPVQHFEGHRSPEDRTAYHSVTVLPGTRLRSVIDVPTLRVNTFHHQGIDGASLAPALVASAMAEPDVWLVEALESPTHRWILGVQWHPERIFELDAAHRSIWRSFVSACNSTDSPRR